MIDLPVQVSLPEAIEILGSDVTVWCTPSVSERMRCLVPWQVQTSAPSKVDTRWLLAAGGGKLIDRAKSLRLDMPSFRLAALPTIWGSGAEASPVAVLDDGPRKVIRVDPRLVPDLRIAHPEFARSISLAMITHACGDVWSHALEAFLSPLCSDALRSDLSSLIERMHDQPIAWSADWLELSALACAGQAKASVGLVHGIAHCLEPVSSWGHAELCSTFLLPVMRFNRANSAKWPLMERHDVDEERVFAVLDQLFDKRLYSRAVPVLSTIWRQVLRDPCSRTNSALVRPADIGFFEAFAL